MSERACKKCEFWEGRILADEPEIGRCHRLPPRAVTEVDAEMHEVTLQIADKLGVDHTFQPIAGWFGSFPLTLLDNWCGEFRPASPTPPA